MVLTLPAAKKAKLEEVAEVEGEEVKDEEMKEEKEEEEEEQTEEDAPVDKRKRIAQPVGFQTGDTTPNVVPSTTGNILLTVKEGGLQYLYAGARCSVGVKSGRYAFEVKIIESLNPAQASGGRPQVGVPTALLRVGFSTKGSGLILGDGADNACFDETGSFLYNKKRSLRAGNSKPAPIFFADSSIVLVLNLQAGSKNFNTISLFNDGERICQQALPEALRGQVLFPTVTFKNLSVHTNFVEEPQVSLPFKCRMLNDASVEDVVVAKSKTQEMEVLFPICLPDQGTFDWLDWFLTENPSRYAELSDRALNEWASKSGISRKVGTVPLKSSNDKPQVGFNLPTLDDGSVKDTLVSLSSLQQRSYVVMEVKGNLLKDDRMAALKKWRFGPYKKIAQVMMGVPEEGFKKRTHDMMLKEKQAKLNKEFAAQQAEKARKKIADQRRKKIEKAVKKAEKARKKVDEEAKAAKAKEDAEMAAAEAEASAAAAGASPPEEGDASGDPPGLKAEDEKKDEEVKDAVKEEKKEEEEEESEDEKMEEPEEEEKPPVATLTPVEKQICFQKTAMPDLVAAVLSANFAKFSIPDESEGFDEVRFTWSSADESAEHLRRWATDLKLTTRIEDLQPSEWFKEKWVDWQKDLQAWHVAHMHFKDPSKKNNSPGFSKAAPLQSPLEKQVALQDDVEDKEKQLAKKDEEDATKDPLQLLEEELDREEMDIFGIDDVCDHDKSGTPLFSNFMFEDWALLSLRFELHLLCHAFSHDADDVERTGIHPEHLSFYYNRYYKKGLNPKNYGVDTVGELIDLVKDTAMADSRSKVVESMVSDDLESNDIFVKLTEESRRDRMRRIDAGEDGAQLKFSRPAGGVGANNMAAAAPASTGGTGGLPPKAVSGIRQNTQSLGIRPKTPGATPLGNAKFGAQQGQGAWGAPSFPAALTPAIRPKFAGLVRPTGMNVMQQRASMLKGQWGGGNAFGGCGKGLGGAQWPRNW